MTKRNKLEEWVIKETHCGEDRMYLPLPQKLFEQWENMNYVQWVDNGDGTYTLIPREDYR
jgi:hypothetical protein